MNYRFVKENGSAKEYNNQIKLLILLMACIIIVQCFVSVVVCIANRGYRDMYNEALERQLEMQREINELRSAVNDER